MSIKIPRLLYLILALDLFSLSTTAQKERCITVGINPFAPLGVTNLPRYEVYGEYFFANSSVALDLGKTLTALREYPDSSDLKRSGFRSAITYKYFLGKKKTFAPGEQPQDRFYIGANLFYWQQQFVDRIGYVHTGNNEDNYADTYEVRRYASGLSLIAGYQVQALRRMLIDAYLGIGYKNLEIKNANREYNYEQGDRRGDQFPVYMGFLFPPAKTFEEQSFSRLNVVCGVRVGYTFFKNRQQSQTE